MKIIKHDNHGFLLLCIVMIILVGFDIYSTFTVPELASALEVNPLYQYIGFTGLIILNLVWFVWIYYFYNRKKAKPNVRFLFIMLLIFSIFLRMAVVQSNFETADSIPSIEEEPIKYEAFKQVMENRTQEQRNDSYNQFIKKQGLIVVMPLVFSFLGYFVLSMDHTIRRKE